MKFKIKITLNQKGQKLFSKSFHILSDITRDYSPLTDEDIDEKIREEFSWDFTEKYEVLSGGLIELEKGDYVKVTVIHRDSSTYHISRVSNITDSAICVETELHPFNFSGDEIVGRKRYPQKSISIPTKEEVERHLEESKRVDLIEKIENLVGEDDYRLSILKTEVLEEIYRLLDDPNSR